MKVRNQVSIVVMSNESLRSLPSYTKMESGRTNQEQERALAGSEPGTLDEMLSPT